MMQQNFKKDSRVWLHKNSRRKCCGKETARFAGVDHQNRQKMKSWTEMDDCVDTTSFITGADGKPYKKDSRTWLHKVKELVTKQKVSLDAVLVPDSHETFLGGTTAGKRKKNTPRGRSGLASISHRDIHILEECDENSLGTYNHCYDKRPRVRYIKGSYSDHDNTNEESSRSDSDGSHSNDVAEYTQLDRKHHRLFRRLCECPLAHAHSYQATLNCNGCDSLPLCRSNASIELTQDGIQTVRDIAREMQLPSARNCSYLVETPDNSLAPPCDQPTCPIDLSSGGLYSSKSSLNVVGANLSDECVTALEEVPGAESDYQLSRATQGLNVQSPIGQGRDHGDQEKITTTTTTVIAD